MDAFTPAMTQPHSGPIGLPTESYPELPVRKVRRQKQMMLDTPIQNAPVWFRSKDYSVVTFNPKVTGCVLGPGWLLEKVLATCPDARRENFYDIEVENGWFYVHVHDDNRTVYVITHWSGFEGAS